MEDEDDANAPFSADRRPAARRDHPHPGQGAEDRPGDPAAGRDLAEEVCSVCHAVPGWEQPAIEAPGARPFAALAADPAVTGMALHAFLRGPHPTMPNIVLSDEELNDVIAYILSLKDE